VGGNHSDILKPLEVGVDDVTFGVVIVVLVLVCY